jgi:hypothetical protein
MAEANKSFLAARVARTRISASAAAAQRARELRAKGIDIVELAQGEPFQYARSRNRRPHARALARRTTPRSMAHRR